MQQFKIGENLQLKIYNSINEFNPIEWNSQIELLPFFQSFHYLQHLEHTQKQINFRYILIFENQVLIGSIYLQQLNFDMKNIFQYNSKTKLTLVEEYFSKKPVYLLYLGNVYFTGDTGIISNDISKLHYILPKVFKYADKTFLNKSFAYLSADFSDFNSTIHNSFTSNGFHILHTEPDLYLILKPDWTNFEDYLNSFSSKYRVRAKKVLRESESIQNKILTYNDVLFYKQEIEQLFENVMLNAQFFLSPLNCNFFVQKHEKSDNICQIHGYFLNEKLVGYSNIYICNKIIHVHYIGLDYKINSNYKLYNRMLLDVVKIGIEHKVEKIHFGRTATEIKTTIGAEPSYFKSFLKIRNPIYNTIATYFLKKILPPKFTVRHPFKLNY
ncbi:MAG TPA: hypothetical protein PLO94_01265 [Chitinophagales bacterium]|nr:hypothetical protein [Chitinophagales bacterium]